MTFHIIFFVESNGRSLSDKNYTSKCHTEADREQTKQRGKKKDKGKRLHW